LSYNPTDLLSLKLSHSVALRKLTRMEMLTRLQIARKLDPFTNELWKKVEEKRWRDQMDDEPHGHPWHVSFHASQFPGDDPKACPRQSLYRMMDLPQTEPTSRWLRSLAEAGKALEIMLVQVYEDAKVLISAPPSEEIQTGFKVEDAWLTGSVDCVIQPPGTNKPLPIEIKTKYQRVIDEMKLGLKGPDDNHVSQLKTQLGLVRYAQEKGELWADMEPVTQGYIYYMSRDNPSDTAEFRVDYDRKFFEAGIAKLKQWKQMFLEDVLPELNPGKRSSKFGHPNGWRWSQTPCQFCSYKKTCQLDFREGVTSLSESAGVNRAKLVRENYDLDKARERVKARWSTERNTK
jgi:CRISPR/Cas system-associated exonuclease Cas4 (RecB family)